MADINLNDMVGTKGTKKKFPKVTIAGGHYTLPVATCNLDNTHFCVLDNNLTGEARARRIAELRALLPGKSTKVKKVADDVQSE